MSALNVLLIDESERDASALTGELSSAGYDVEATRVDTADALMAALGRQHWDVAISDFTLPQLSGARALALVREHGGDLPFIFVSGTHGEDAAVEAMRIGAQDFITKDNLARLASAVEHGLRDAAERRERLRESERVAYLAFHDELTDLPNRTLLHDRLHQALLEAKREMRPLSLLVLDLDGFKEINDSLGHHAGDRVLQAVAARLRTTLRQSDTVARLGGDEFAILLPITDATGAELAASKILQEIEMPMVLEGKPAFVRGSIGIAAFPEHGSGEQELLQKSDIAMYAAKNDRCGFAVYTADRDGCAEQSIALVTAMWQGIEDDQFALDYQPIVNLRTGDTIALEALLRWNHPQHGRLPPGQFIQLAEHSGLITRLTLFAIHKALSEWPCRTHGITVSVNVSPRSLHDASFPGRVRAVLESLGADCTCLSLEITENVIMSDAARALQCLDELHAMGIKLVIDDFGTGYSSLSHLRRLPVSQLKIDRSFISGLTLGEDDALVRSIIDLAHNLKLEIVAEGVDSLELHNRLRALGCDAAQGHFISEPAPAATIAPRVTRRDRSRFESV
jgi:diguanylate cyclase (GGDEF)-like protein